MITLYHGSDHLFDKFSFVKVGTESGTKGAGFGLYFTNNQTDASSYGQYIYTVQVQLQNELSKEKITLPKHIILLILQHLLSGGIELDVFESPSRPTKTDEFYNVTLDLMTFCKSDTEVIQAIIDRYGCYNAVMQIISKLGYTHCVDQDTPSNITIVNYAIYDLKAITIQRVDTIDTLHNVHGIDYMQLNESWNILAPTLMVSKSIVENCYNNLFYLDFDDLMESEEELFEAVGPGEGGKAKSKSQRGFFVMALRYKQGKLDRKYYAGKPEFEAKLKRLSAYDDDTLRGFTNTFEKKRKKSGEISKRNAIPDRVKKKKKVLKKKKKIVKKVVKKDNTNNTEIKNT